MSKMIWMVLMGLSIGAFSSTLHAMKWIDTDLINTNYESSQQDYTVATNEHFEFFCKSLVQETPLRAVEKLVKKIDPKFNLSRQIQSSFFDIGNDTLFNRRLINNVSIKTKSQEKRLSIEIDWLRNLKPISRVTFFQSNISYKITENIKIYHNIEIGNNNAELSTAHDFSLFMYKNKYEGTFFCDVDIINTNRVRFGFVKSF